MNSQGPNENGHFQIKAALINAAGLIIAAIIAGLFSVLVIFINSHINSKSSEDKDISFSDDSWKSDSTIDITKTYYDTWGKVDFYNSCSGVLYINKEILIKPSVGANDKYNSQSNTLYTIFYLNETYLFLIMKYEYNEIDSFYNFSFEVQCNTDNYTTSYIPKYINAQTTERKNVKIDFIMDTTPFDLRTSSNVKLFTF